MKDWSSILLFSTASRLDLGLPQPQIKLVRFSPGVKLPGPEVDHSPPSSAEVKNNGAVRPLPRMSSLLFNLRCHLFNESVSRSQVPILVAAYLSLSLSLPNFKISYNIKISAYKPWTLAGVLNWRESVMCIGLVVLVLALFPDKFNPINFQRNTPTPHLPNPFTQRLLSDVIAQNVIYAAAYMSDLNATVFRLVRFLFYNPWS
jgi:hypothetical protein